MRSMRGKTVFGAGMVAVAIAMSVTGCAARADDEVAPVDIADELEPTGKPSKTPGPTMTCAQATNGCVPVGYRAANCAMSGLKPNTYVVTCVKTSCPSVYGGFRNGSGEICFTPQKVALDGTALAFFALAPDATYSLTTYASKNGVQGEAFASSEATLSSSVGEATQCGGVPAGSCM